VGRADVLAAVLGLAALNAHAALFCRALALAPGHEVVRVEDQRPASIFSLLGLVLPVTLIIASGLCKETGFTFFAILLLMEFLDALSAHGAAARAGKRIPARVWRRRYQRVGVLIVVTVMVFFARYRHTGGTALNMSPQDNPISFESSRSVRILSYAYIHGVYATLLCWPKFLCYDYSMDAIPPVVTTLDCRLLLPVTAYVGFAAVVTSTLRKAERHRRAGLISLAVLVLPFLPASNILFPVGTVIGERLLYVPSAGFCLLILAWLHGICTRTTPAASNGSAGTIRTETPPEATHARSTGSSRRQRAASREPTARKTTNGASAGSAEPPRVAGPLLTWTILLLALTVVAGGVRTLLRVYVWESSETLFIHDGHIQPTSAKTQFNLGITYMQLQEWEPAVTALVRCAWADPLSSLPFYRIGQIEILRGRFQSAENWLSAAIDKFGASLMVRDEEVFHDLAVAMFQNGKAEAAERRLQIALRLNPDFAKGWNNFACCIASRDLQKAARAARKAVSLAPENPQYWANLALLARHTRDPATMDAAWRRAVELYPSMPEPNDCTWEFAPAG